MAEKEGFVALPFKLNGNKCFAPSNPREQQSTGLLHLMVQIPPETKKQPPFWVAVSFGGEGGI